ncbi:MAG: ethanolamine utilization cob(I)yrinic acid a,c-diamide adenosyltransferase EutT [Desulfovibrio sp.]|jgi:ethanolamine utilization cobalamin adenosyltransferase|nr:ethanolamine utilization cob(I)yrinic acid a,c-diamide adenosyltransferase EutT [Desulfovibrio sp.]
MDADITETWLRERFGLGRGSEIRLPAGSRLTPAAQALLDERNVVVKYVDFAGRVFLPETSSRREPGLRRVHALIGGVERRKGGRPGPHAGVGRRGAKSAAPDSQTSPDAYAPVAKNDPRLKLRGKLDSVIALAVLIQTEFDPEGRYPAQARRLGDIRSALGNALKAEVDGGPMAPVCMGDMDEEMLHAVSHNPMKYLGHDHLLPEACQGARTARLNLLRAQIREAELYAADMYITRDGCVTRPDLMRGLNRLSSAVYVLMLLTYLAEQGRELPSNFSTEC